MTDLAEAINPPETNGALDVPPQGGAVLALVTEVEPVVTNPARLLRTELRELDAMDTRGDLPPEVEARLLNYIAAAEVIKRHADGIELTSPEIMLGTAAEGALIRSFTALINSKARRLRQGNVAVEDLVQVGRLGVIEAAKIFDDKKTTFFKFATTIIIRRMIDTVRAEAWYVRQNGSQISRRRSVERLEDQEEVPGDIRKELSISLRTWRNMQARSSFMQMASLDMPVNAEGDEVTVGDLVAKPDLSHVAEDVWNLAAIRDYIETSNHLTEQEREVLSLKYFDGYLEQAEIAERFGLTVSRICQLHVSGLRKLRVNFGLEAPELPVKTPIIETVTQADPVRDKALARIFKEYNVDALGRRQLERYFTGKQVGEDQETKRGSERSINPYQEAFQYIADNFVLLFGRERLQTVIDAICPYSTRSARQAQLTTRHNMYKRFGLMETTDPERLRRQFSDGRKLRAKETEILRQLSQLPVQPTAL